MSPSSTFQSAPSSSAELLRVENLRIHFPIYSGRLRQRQVGLLRAVDGVSLTLRQGEALALVGAPGCGKTTLARAIALLEGPTAGRVFFRGQELTGGRHLRRARRQVQILFSNPYTAFAPRITVEEIIAEALRLNRPRFGHRQDQELSDLMARVGLNLYLAVRFPRDLSGGNRQRLALARALAAEPALLVCDQPSHYLDPAMGDAFIDLLHGLRKALNLTLLLTTRRLERARRCDRVAVMVLGRVVEMGYYADVLGQPLHPFTQALLRPSASDFIAGVGRTLDLLHPGTGCHYAPVCPLVEARCHDSYPPLVAGVPDHGVACHLVEPHSLFSKNALDFSGK
jgi:oligopeptide/dipeptide ABC transporter ATP-binding protein